jgi:hypothetical protein
MPPNKPLDKPIIYMDEKSGQYVMYDPNTSDFKAIPSEQAMGSLINRTAESPGQDDSSRQYSQAKLEALRRIQDVGTGYDDEASYEDRHIVNPRITRRENYEDNVRRKTQLRTEASGIHPNIADAQVRLGGDDMMHPDSKVKVDIEEPELMSRSYSALSDPDAKIDVKAGKAKYLVRYNSDDPVDVEMGDAKVTGRIPATKFPALSSKLKKK